MTAFAGSRAGRGALQPIQAFWEALGMSMSVSKLDNTGSQHSCTVLPSIQGWLCVLSSRYHVLPLYGIIKKCQGRRYMFAVCVLLCQELHPALSKVSLLLQPWDRAALSSLPNQEAAALTPEQASSSSSSVPEARSWAYAADQIAQKPLPNAVCLAGLGLSSALSFSLYRDFPTEVPHVLCGTVVPLVLQLP